MNNRITLRISAFIIAFALCISSVFVMPLTEVNASGNQRNAYMIVVKKGSSAFNYRVAAGEKLYGYDTLQGACANKGYAYLTLYNRNVENCKIVKVRIKTREVVKVSAPLPVYHANCLTYNTKINRLVATCCRVKDKRAVFIDPVKLTVTSYRDIQLTGNIKGLPSRVRRNYKGFTAIAYNSQKNCYVGRLRGDNNVIIFNVNFVPVRYVVLQGKQTALLNQGMDSYGNYIYDVRSFKGSHKYSMVTVHTMSGKLVGKVKFPFGRSPGNELQCIFHDGKQFFAGFYYTTSQAHDYASNHVKRTNTLYYLGNIYK